MDNIDVKIWLSKRLTRKKRKGKAVYSYAVQWRDPRTGKKRTETVGRDRAYAEQALEQRRRELETGVKTGITRITYDEFVQEHLWQLENQLSAGSYREHELVLKQFKGVCDPQTLTTIDFQMLERFRTARIKTGVSPATVNKGLRTFQSILERAAKRGYIKQNPFRGNRQALWVREPEPVVRTLESVNFQKLLDGCLDDRWRAICTLGYYAGLRRSEILHLEWDDVDFDGQVLHVRNKENHATKSRKNRSVPMSSQVISALQKLTRLSIRDSFVFKNLFGGQMINNVSRDFAQIVVRAGLTDDQDKPRYTMHDLRRSCATNLLRVGTPPKTVQRLLGHANLTTTMTYYAGVENKDLRDAIKRLEQTA